MGFTIDQAEREDLVVRMDDHLAAICFHCFGETHANSSAKAEEIEARAFATADAASKTTSESWSADSGGGHAVHQLTTLYVKKAAELLKEEALRCGKAKDATSSQDADAQFFDLSGSDREFFTQQRAEQGLAPLLAAGARFSKVRLSSKSFGLDAAHVVAKAFANNADTLKEVDLSDIFPGRPEEEAMKVMQIVTEATLCAKITSVDVSDNAFGEKGVRACTAMLQQQNEIESITFINNGISEQAAKAISELLVSPQSLKKLHLDKNMTGDAGTAHIAALLERAPGMEDFKMAGSRFFSKGAVMLARGLSTGTSLVSLDLNDNNINEEGGLALSGMLFKQPNLRHLNFEAAMLGSHAAGAVVSALAAGCPKLEYLNLSCCDIYPGGVPAVAKAISAMKNLKVLKIAENELGDFGVARICMALKESGCPLVELDVSTNELVQAGAIAAARLAISKASFTSLNLDGNYISDEGVEKVKAVMEEAGISFALLPMEENDADMAEEAEDEADEDQESRLNKMLDDLRI
jgi:Ran GTPase-activating protein (RanGAP) involved in mRNA processing and transport